MIVKEIEIEEFDNFASKHILANFYQTSYYGISMRKMGYKDMYIGIYKNYIS